MEARALWTTYGNTTQQQMSGLGPMAPRWLTRRHNSGRWECSLPTRRLTPAGRLARPFGLTQAEIFGSTEAQGAPCGASNLLLWNGHGWVAAGRFQAEAQVNLRFSACWACLVLL